MANAPKSYADLEAENLSLRADLAAEHALMLEVVKHKDEIARAVADYKSWYIAWEKASYHRDQHAAKEELLRDALALALHAAGRSRPADRHVGELVLIAAPDISVPISLLRPTQSWTDLAETVLRELEEPV